VNRRPRHLLGFTLVELLVTMALIGIAASVVVPYGALIEARSKETELRSSLRTIRQALDAYKAASDAGLIEKPTGSSGYPPNLDILVTGAQRSSAFGFSATPVVFLRRLPRDPFFPDKTMPAAQTWNTRSYGARPGDFAAGQDVFDVSTQSSQLGLDGSVLSDW
jgi:general secretion pathway protein G